MTVEETKKILAIVKAAYPNAYKDMTKKEALGTVTVWASQFAEMPATVVLIAVNKLISTNTFPPSIKEVKESIRGLYWEAWEAVNYHERGILPLPPKKLSAMQEIVRVCEPMQSRQSLEPTLGELIDGFAGYLQDGENEKLLN